MLSNFNLPQSIFKGLSLFKNLNDAEIASLTSGSLVQNYTKGQTIFKQGDVANYSLIVIKGQIKIIKKNGTHESILTLIKPGEIAGAMLMTDSDSVYPGDLIALNHSTVVLISKKTYLSTWVKNPQLMSNINNCIQLRVKQIQEDKFNQTVSVQKRLATFLIRNFSNSTQTSQSELRLSRAEIAAAIGSKTETVIRAIKVLERQGIISTIGHGKIEILKPDELKKIINSDD